MIEKIGPLQLIILERARLAKSGMIATGGFLEARACRRLEARNLLERIDTSVEPHWYRRSLFHRRQEYYRLTSYGRNAHLISGGRR